MMELGGGLGAFLGVGCEMGTGCRDGDGLEAASPEAQVGIGLGCRQCCLVLGSRPACWLGRYGLCPPVCCAPPLALASLAGSGASGPISTDAGL